MQINYDQSLKEVLRHEGGYTNEAADPGGPTNFGITIADYRRYINSNGTAQDVKSLKLADAKNIYKSKYWDALNCDNLPGGVDYAVFDYGINSGIARARKVLAKFPNKTPVDLINAICDERMAFLQKLSNWPTYKGGWTRRVSDVRTLAIKMATAKPASPVVTHPVVLGPVIAAPVIAATATHPHLWPWIVGACIVLAIVGFIYIKVRNTNVNLAQ